MPLSAASEATRAHSLEHAFSPPFPSFSHRPYVVGALLEFGRRLNVGRSRLAPAGAADDLVRTNPFAFLVAVLLDQGVPAERAFSAPLVLAERLGELSPEAVLARPSDVRRAMWMRPMPHRFPNQASTWILAAARRIADGYGGRTERLWSGQPTAKALQQRLEDFEGIGQKKAAMAVEILERDLGVRIGGLSGSDVAVDVHVRRVFRRAGLVDSDTISEVVRAARVLHPERPGELDGPAWVIGRTWCRPRRPNCGACPLGWFCQASSALRLQTAGSDVQVPLA